MSWFYLLLSISAPFYGYWKIFTKPHGKERSRNKDLRSHQGIDLRISRTDGRAPTNRANPFPCYSLLLLSRRSLLVFQFCRPLCPRSPGTRLRIRGKGRKKIEAKRAERYTRRTSLADFCCFTPFFAFPSPTTIEPGPRLGPRKVLVFCWEDHQKYHLSTLSCRLLDWCLKLVQKNFVHMF